MRKRKTGQNLHLSNLNFKIIIYALILSIIGIFMVHSATQNEAVTGMITYKYMIKNIMKALASLHSKFS